MMQENEQPAATPAAPAPPKNRRWLRILFSLLVISLVSIQFFQPGKNNNEVVAKNNITALTPLPDTIHQLLKKACYDCHSNNTNYPWYTNIQPLGWWLQQHIEEGKAHLNFDEFANLQPRNGRSKQQRQLHKLEEVKKSIEEGWMPLNSYTWMHKEARLTDAEKQLIIGWVDSARKTILSAASN